MVIGIITGRTILLNTPLIIREYGFSTWCRCIGALVSSRQVTFLSLVCRCQK